jgi:hypothetical protein
MGGQIEGHVALRVRPLLHQADPRRLTRYN